MAKKIPEENNEFQKTVLSYEVSGVISWKSVTFSFKAVGLAGVFHGSRQGYNTCLELREAGLRQCNMDPWMSGPCFSKFPK